MGVGKGDFFYNNLWGQTWNPGVLATGADYDSPAMQWTRYARGANLVLYCLANTGGVSATVKALQGFPLTVVKTGVTFTPQAGLVYVARFHFDKIPGGMAFDNYIGFRLTLAGGTSIAQGAIMIADGLRDAPSGYPEAAHNKGAISGIHYNKFNNGLLQEDGAGQSRIVLDEWM